MAQQLVSTTADAVIAFQHVPGVDNETIIDAGPADNRTTGAAVNSVRGGYYGVRWGAEAYQDLEILGTTYRIYRLAQNAPLPALGPALAGPPGWWPPKRVGAWEGVWNQSDSHRTQHCLQLLGYYRGDIDGNLARESEDGLLSFQADQNKPILGLGWLWDWLLPPLPPAPLPAYALAPAGAPSANLVDEIETVVTDNNHVARQGGGPAVYLVRQPLLRFTRSPSGGNPDTEFGPPDPEAPEVDDRGYISAEACGHNCRGPVVSMAYEVRGSGAPPQPGYKFRVKVLRDGIADDAPLVAESENPARLSMGGNHVAGGTSTINLLAGRNMKLEMRTGDPGNQSRLVQVFIKWQRGVNDLVTIATLHVIVLPMKTFKIRPWRVSIGGQEPQRTNAQLDAAFQRANDIWRPYGIKFKIFPWKNRTLNLSHPGAVTVTTRRGRSSLNWECNAIYDHFSHARYKMNVYFVRQIVRPSTAADGPAAPNLLQYAFGATQSPLLGGQGKGIVMQDRSEGADDAERVARTGDTLAHELGHFLGLANNHDDPRFTHVEDHHFAPPNPLPPAPRRKRHDSWSIRRLMLGTAPERLAFNRAWAWINGYWDPTSALAYIRGKIPGKMVSLRSLPQDQTDNECLHARSRADRRNPYR